MAKQTISDTVLRQQISLYRKYRPDVFEEVRGQEHIVSVLEAAVKQEKIAHAYLFAGGRGTGKTSTARILAKAVGTSPEDIYEMDAASNRGIDEIRALREGVSTLPFRSNYKFYIIDEAHALTPQAWGALLKTLEEPPTHVVFVLATTELDRVPETIISRCQTFQFKKPTKHILTELAIDVGVKENIVIEPSAAELVALMGDGSYRDTLGILQKVLTVSQGKKVTEEEVAVVVGAPKSKTLRDFLVAIAEKNGDEALKQFSSATQNGVEPKVFLLLAISYIRSILLMRFAPTSTQELGGHYSPEDFALIEKLSGKDGAAINATVLSEFLTAYLETSRAPIATIPLELALYRISAI